MGQMTISIGRRKFIAGLGGSALARPFVARAQQPAPPLIGFLSSTSPDPPLRRVAAFRQGLGEVGYTERGDVVIDFRWAENQAYQLPRMAVELVRRQVAVIATAGGTVSARAAKQATSTIPIVFEIGGDPIAAGLVDQLNRPGGNLTGVSMNAPAVGATQLDFLRELVPKASLVAVLSNPNNPNSGTQARVEAAARIAGMNTLVVNVTNENGFDAPFITLVQQHADALVVGNDPFFINWREKIIALAARYAVPTIYGFRDYAVAGGLMTYGPLVPDAYRQVGVYVGRILKGEKPADLPVVLSTKFELVINITTARTLGFNVPPSLLTRATEVIE
jgi:putative ABC transport system substrate-binding protein